MAIWGKGPQRRSVSRREFFRLAALTGGAALLAACGPAPTAAIQPTPSQARPVAGPTAVPATEVPPISGALRYLGWEGYDAADTQAFPSMARWLQDHAVALASTYTSDNAAELAKVKTAGPGAYDLCTPYIGEVPTWVESDLLEPIDPADLRNWADLFPEFTGLDAAAQGGQLYAVPFTWAPIALLYNADKVEAAPTSWNDLLEPRFKGRVSIVDGYDSFITVMALILGYRDPDPHHLTREQLAQCRALGRRFLAQAQDIAPSYIAQRDALVAGKADVTLGSWAAVAGWCQAEGVDIQVALPAEGALTYIDAYAMPKGAPNRTTALAFIDQILSPQTQAEMAAYVSQGVVNRKAVELLPARDRDRFDYAHLDDLLARAPAYPPVPEQSDRYATATDWVAAWKELKAGRRGA